MKTIDQNKLAEMLKPLYQKMFDEVAEAKDEEYIKFCIQWGENYPTQPNEGIVFYGRANNGWMCHDVTVEDVFDPNNEDTAFAREDQMIWVEDCAGPVGGYNTNTSAFWRVLRGVAQKFYPEGDLRHVAWSNLCKIAPDGANPSDALYYSQLKSASDIMACEVEFFSPRHVVLFTGEGWAMPFLKQLFGKDELNAVATATFGSARTYEIKVYEKDGVFYYLSEHPQGKNESTHVEALVDLIKQNSKKKIFNKTQVVPQNETPWA